MRKLIGALVLAASAACAWGQDGKGYVGVGLGTSKYKIDICDSVSCDETGFAWNVRAGYHFFPWLGVEAAYLDFGEAITPGVLLNPPPGTIPVPTDSDARTFGFVVSLVGRIPLGPVNVMGRVGWGAITGKFRGNAAVFDPSNNTTQYFQAQNRDTGGRFVYGAGVSYDFADAWSARLDWDRTKADDGFNPKYDVEMYTLGVHHRF